MIEQLKSIRAGLSAQMSAIDALIASCPPQEQQPLVKEEMVIKIVKKLDLEATGDVPNLEGVDLPTEKVDTTNPKAPGLEYIERDSEKFIKLLEFSMFKGWQKSHVDNFLLEKGMALSAKNEEHLQECRNFAAMEKRGEMDVKTLLSQSCLSDAERSFLTNKMIF
jgi:hypothetical protein